MFKIILLILGLYFAPFAESTSGFECFYPKYYALKLTQIYNFAGNLKSKGKEFGIPNYTVQVKPGVVMFYYNYRAKKYYIMPLYSKVKSCKSNTLYSSKNSKKVWRSDVKSIDRSVAGQVTITHNWVGYKKVTIMKLLPNNKCLPISELTYKRQANGFKLEGTMKWTIMNVSNRYIRAQMRTYRKMKQKLCRD